MMEYDLMALPPLMAILLVLWTLALLTYKALMAALKVKKTTSPHARLLQDDEAPTECVYRTGEYFLKSSGPCLCTGVISGVVTRISEIDRFRLFHETPGYSQMEDTLHVKLTGLKISQNHGADTCKTISFETVVGVGDYSSSAKTATLDHPGENAFLYNRGIATLPDNIHGNPQNDNYFDERMLGFNAFEINKTSHISEDIKVQIPSENVGNRLLVVDPPNDSGQPISIISPMKPPVFEGNGVILPKYGKLNKRNNLKLSGFNIIEKNRTSSTKDPHLPSAVRNASNINQTVKELPTLIGNTDIAWDNTPTVAKDIQNQTRGTPNPAVSIPVDQSSISDNNVILPPGSDPECPLFDIILHEGMAENKILEDRNPRLDEYLTNVPGREAACSVGDLRMSNVPPSNTTPLHIEICQQIRTPGADDNPVQIHDEETAEQLETFLHGPVVNSPTVLGSYTTTNSIVSGSNKLALPEASPRNIYWRLPQIENSLKNQTLSSECLHIETPDPNNITGCLEETMIPMDNSHTSNDSCFKIGSSDRGYAQTDMKSTFYSCGGAGTITKAAGEYDSVVGDESPDSASVKHQMITSGYVTEDLDGEPSSRKSNADEKDFIREDKSHICGPRMLTTFSPDNRAMDCYKEVLRSIIISRRKSAISSSSSHTNRSTSGDDSFSFSPTSPGHNGFDCSAKDLPRTKAICSCTGMISGRVTHVTDGDSFRLLHKCVGQLELCETRVRLAGIDAPESPEQPFSEESKEHLTDLIYEKDVDVDTFGLDRYGRVLGMVYLPPLSENINLEMVRCGYACIYSGKGAVYGKYEEDLKRLEEEAKNLKKGMWSQTDIVLPGDYKRQRSCK